MIHTNHYSKTFVDVLTARASATPDRSVYHMLADDGSESGALTFGELDRRARALGHHLQGLNARGERVLLLYPAGLDYITAFFGCMYGGAIAVPAYPPRMNRNLSRLLSIVESCSPKFILTDSSLIAAIRAGLANHPALQSVHWIATDLFDFSGDTGWVRPPLGSDSLAFLQYTSGSTADPKGVMVTHANLLHNEALIQKAFALSSETVVVSWLPIYHDMGLIGNVLASAYNGARCYIMSPAAFLRRPAAWFEAISRFGATASGGPNFAYELCVQKVQAEHCAGLDLSRWSIAFSGAEPVRAATLDRFAAKFAPYGFRREALYPCYGMAETTLFVTGGRIEEPPVIQAFDKSALQQNQALEPADPSTGESYVSSGRSQVERVVIVDPATRTVCAEASVGEIWISDPSVAAGYWNNPDLTAATFRAHIATTGEGPFLRTGDLGVIKDGELFVMGRTKDLIIIRGRNHYPQDIELTAELSHPGLRPGCTVAFSVEAGGEERLIVVGEAARERRSSLVIDEMGEKVHRAVAEEHGVAVSELVLLQPAGSLKTSSGKLQRGATRQAYLSGELNALKVWRNVVHDERLIETAYMDTSAVDLHGMEAWLEAEVCARLKIPQARFDRNRPIAEYGIDSLAGVELVAAIEEKLGMELPFESLFVAEPSLTRLAGIIREELALKAAVQATVGMESPGLARPLAFPVPTYGVPSAREAN